eukprot:COSAG06_NODE_7224_length_2581_cov_1.892425_4_plen_92_part_00
MGALCKHPDRYGGSWRGKRPVLGTRDGGASNLRLHPMWRAPRRHSATNSQAVCASSTGFHSRADRNGIVGGLGALLRVCVHAQAEMEWREV